VGGLLLLSGGGGGGCLFTLLGLDDGWLGTLVDWLSVLLEGKEKKRNGGWVSVSGLKWWVLLIDMVAKPESNTHVSLVPLPEWSSIDLDDGTLDESLGSEKLVVRCVVDLEERGFTTKNDKRKKRKRRRMISTPDQIKTKSSHLSDSQHR
jgi:hypothetical protein